MWEEKGYGAGASMHGPPAFPSRLPALNVLWSIHGLEALLEGAISSCSPSCNLGLPHKQRKRNLPLSSASDSQMAVYAPDLIRSINNMVPKAKAGLLKAHALAAVEGLEGEGQAPCARCRRRPPAHFCSCIPGLCSHLWVTTLVDHLWVRTDGTPPPPFFLRHLRMQPCTHDLCAQICLQQL